MEERAYDEGVMKKAGEILADERLKAFDGMNGEEKVFSRRFERKKEKLFRRAAGTGTRGRVTGRRALRIIAVCAASVVLMTVSVMAVPPVREAFDGFRTWLVAERKEDRTLYFEVESDGGAFVITGGEPSYIPEGYALTERDDKTDPSEGSMPSLWLTYERPDGEYAAIRFIRAGTASYTDWDGAERSTRIGFNFGGSETEPEPVRIGPYEGTRMRVDEAGNGDPPGTLLVWSDTRYYYVLFAVTEDVPQSGLIPLPYDELLRMAESVSHDAVSAADEQVLFGFIPEEEGEPVTEGICPRCGEYEIRAVCSHQTVLNDEGEPVIDMIPGETGADGTETGTMRQALRQVEMCYTDHTCPGCGYRVSGGRDDCHAEWLLNDTGEKIPVCPYRDE